MSGNLVLHFFSLFQIILRRIGGGNRIEQLIAIYVLFSCTIVMISEEVQ